MITIIIISIKCSCTDSYDSFLIIHPCKFLQLTWTCSLLCTLMTNKSEMTPRRDKTCEMVSAGEHGNAELINKYGFALTDNPFDSIKLDKGTLVAQAADAMGEEACKERCAFLHLHR